MNDAIIQDDLDDFVTLDNISKQEETTTRPMMTDDVVPASGTNELNTLYQALPESTHAERCRFLLYRDGDTKLAIIKLGNYLDWRRQHSYDDDSSCCHFDSPWTYATQFAIRDDAITTNSNEELKLSNVDKKCNNRTVDTT
jgi:hypothetical protein